MINELMIKNKEDLVEALKAVIKKIEHTSVKQIKCHIEIDNEIYRKDGVDRWGPQTVKIELKIL